MSTTRARLNLSSPPVDQAAGLTWWAALDGGSGPLTVGVMDVGEDNAFGHPSSVVLDRLGGALPVAPSLDMPRVFPGNLKADGSCSLPHGGAC